VAGPRVTVAVEVENACWAIADQTQLEQLVMNLVGNARDSMPDGGTVALSCGPVTLAEETRAAIGAVPAGTWLRIAVADQGVGMSADVLARALEPFFTTKPVGQGTGLGLATVQTIVQGLQGHLTIDSQPGVGTTVCCWMPLHAAPVAAAESPSAPVRAEPATDAEGRCILVVDDEPMVRSVAQRILERRGYAVVTADDGATALAQIEAGLVPDLVLTDVMMPMMTGRALADALQARGMEVPVVFMSGYAREELLADGMLGQELPLVHKPFTVAALLEAVREGVGV
jgi:CheY-like chemotaxis protein